jgi:hypothetical protein
MNDATMIRRVRRVDNGEPLILPAPPEHEVAAYAVETAVCANPECHCTQMWLSIHQITEIDGKHGKIGQAAVGGHVASDGTGVQLDRPTAAVASETVTWIGQQLEQETYRAWLEERWRRGRGQVGDPAYPSGVPPEDPDGMVLFSDVFPYDFDLTVEDQGSHYFAPDQYCLEPGCNCDEIVVQFADLRGGTKPVGHVRVSLERLTVPEVHGPDLVKRLWHKLLDWYGPERIRDRFRRMRQVAQQRPPRRPAASIAAPSLAPAAKVGRNEACPCGSGKKFKRCCGA